MSKFKLLIVILITALIAGGGVYFWQSDQSSTSDEWATLIQYNCELSNGSFVDGSCECTFDPEWQTQEEMYDKSTGYCQTDHGGPGGDALAASVGMAHGSYAFWSDIVGYNCKESGGEWWPSAACTCPEETTYDEETGYCE
jgi:hypothetical protein